MNSSQDSVIQCILDMVRKGQTIETIAMKVFDLVAIREEFDIEQTVQIRDIKRRPIEMAVHLKMFDMVVKLIMAGADCHGIEYEQLKRNESATKLLKLLYHLGIYVDIASGDLIYDWVKRQQVKSLQQLAALAVRSNCTRKELKEAIADIVLPDIVKDYFDLKHLTFDEELNLDDDNSDYDEYRDDYFQHYSSDDSYNSD